MEWQYTMTCTPGPRLLMRVALIFDQQLLTLEELTWNCVDDGAMVRVRVLVRCEEGLARRMHAKLLHLYDVMTVELTRCAEDYSGGVKRPSTAVQPPSTMVSVPVTNEPASDAR